MVSLHPWKEKKWRGVRTRNRKSHSTHTCRNSCVLVVHNDLPPKNEQKSTSNWKSKRKLMLNTMCKGERGETTKKNCRTWPVKHSPTVHLQQNYAHLTTGEAVKSWGIQSGVFRYSWALRGDRGKPWHNLTWKYDRNWHTLKWASISFIPTGRSSIA